MKLTNEWLKNHNACKEAVEWFEKQTEREELKLLKMVMEIDHFDWAYWYIVRRLNRINIVRYEIYFAKQLLEIYESIYPDDDRLRKGIEAAERWLNNPSKESGAAAYASAAAAAYASYAVNTAAAVDASYTFAAAAAACAYPTYAVDAGAADDCLDKEIKRKIVNYGIKLIRNDVKYG